MTPTKRTWARLAAVAAALFILSFGTALPAHAFDGIATYAADGTIGADGSLAVKATLTPEGSLSQVVQRFATRMSGPDGADYAFALDGIRVTADGQDVGALVTQEGDYAVVTMPSKGTSPLVLEYTVRGAALRTGAETTVSWRLLQGLSLPVREFNATLSMPGQFTFIDCAAGAPGSPGACSWFAGGTHDQPGTEFHDGPRGAGEVVQVMARFPSDVVASNEVVVQRWSLDRAFSLAPVPLATAAGLALFGGVALWLLHRRMGRDQGAGVEPLVLGTFRPVGAGQSEFVLLGEVRPGEVGTLADERVDPIDVTASVLDLAVRNHLLIEELPRETQFQPTDWALSRRESAAALLEYERALLDAVAPASGEPRRLSEAGAALQAALPLVQSGLYDEVVAKGWFAVRPDATRGLWTRIGWLTLGVSAAIAAVLIALTSFGVSGLVLVALAASVGLLAQAMPARTARGAAALAGLGVLRGVLATQPTDEMPKGREHEELSQVLPYAVVLGGTDRWLTSLSAVNDEAIEDATELSWYHGPTGWQLSDLPDSLRNFVRAVQGTLVSR